MSITAWDIKEAAFSSDVKDVEELILTNKGAIDVGALCQAVNLRSLSLAFNSLASLAGLSPLVRLQSLNVSHNQLASLKGLQALSSLVTLNASHNKVVSLAPLSGLSALADLWLQNNAVAAPGELRVLAGLPGLQRLAIANNPLSKALPADHVRLLALRLCPGLRVIDGRPVEAAERAASEGVDIEALLSSRPAAPGSAPAATPTLGSLGSLGGGGGGGGDRPGSGSRTSSFSGDGGGRGARPGRPGGRSANGSHGLPESRLRQRNRSSSYEALLGGSGSRSGSALASPQSDWNAAAGGGGVDPRVGLTADDAVQAALEAVASSSSTGSSSQTGGRLRRSGGSGRRPPLPGGPLRPASQLQGTQFQAVVDALPRFDPAKLPTRYNGAAAKPRPPPPAAIVKPPPDAHLVDFEARYATQRGGGRAVVVRRDGSAAAFWPGGDMAVTVDTDYSAVVQTLSYDDDDGGDGAEQDGRAAAAAATGPSYKMMVMYRAGGVAVSWDAQGGFVQYPSGGLMLMYSRSTGTGTCYSPSGEITRRWRDVDAVAAAPPTPSVAISLPFPLSSSSSSPPAPPPPAPATIDMQLDPHLGIRFLGASHSLELYWSCEAVRYRFRCGRNAPGEVWDPPPGRSDSTATSTSTSGTQTPALYDNPPSPGGGGVAAAAGGGGGAGPRWPLLSADALASYSGGVGGEAEDGAGLPPPSFLRNLARQGGAGTHRPVGAAAAAKQAAAAAAAAGGAGGAGGLEAGGSELANIASITAGLQALDDGLQAWLARDRSKDRDSSRGAGTTPEGLAPEPATTINSNGTNSVTSGTNGGPRSPLQPVPQQPASRTPAKAGRRTGGGSGVSAARAIAAEAEAATAPPPPSPPSPPPAAESGAEGAAGREAPAGGALEGGAAGGPPRASIDSDVAAQLAAARKLAADSLAAAMAAANAAAAIGSLPSS